MRIYQPLEIKREGKSTGLWHFTVSSDEEGWVYPVGACAKDCPGHPNAELAAQHYDQGRLRTATFDAHVQWMPCEVPRCPAPARTGARLTEGARDTVALCENHLNAAGLWEAMGRYRKQPKESV